MSKINIPQKIRVEDFNSDQQDLVSKLAFGINSFMDSVYALLNKDIDFTNLNRDLVDVTVKIDSAGLVINKPQVKFQIKNNKVRGVTCVRAINTKAPAIYPTNTPFVTWTLNNGILMIQSVTGLPISSEYQLTLELIG